MTQEEILIKLGVNGTALASGLRSATEKIGHWAHEVKAKIGEAFSELAAPLAGLFAVEKIRETIREAISFGKEIKNAGEESGTSSEFIQGLQKACHVLNMEFEGTSMAINKLSVNVGKARSGSDDAAASFKKWGISIEGLRQEDIIYQIADKLKEMKDPAERNAMAFELMGKSAKEIGSGFAVGADALKGIIDGASKISDDGIEKLAALDAKLEEIGRKWKVFWASAVVAVSDTELPQPPGMSREELEKRMYKLAKAAGEQINMEGFWLDRAHGMPDKRTQDFRDEAINDFKKEESIQIKKSEAGEKERTKREKDEKEIARLQAEGGKIEHDSLLKKLTLSGQLRQMNRDRLELFNKLAMAEAGSVERAKVELDLKKNDAEREKVVGELSKEELKRREKMAQIGKQISDATVKIVYEQGKRDDAARAPYMPTLDELAQSGSWMHSSRTGRNRFQRGPYAKTAKDIQWLEADAKQAVALGNIDWANKDISRANFLKDGLRAAGVLGPDTHLESMDESLKLQQGHLKDLLEKANGKGGGVAVTATEGP